MANDLTAEQRLAAVCDNFMLILQEVDNNGLKTELNQQFDNVKLTQQRIEELNNKANNELKGLVELQEASIPWREGLKMAFTSPVTKVMGEIKIAEQFMTEAIPTSRAKLKMVMEDILHNTPIILGIKDVDDVPGKMGELLRIYRDEVIPLLDTILEGHTGETPDMQGIEHLARLPEIW